MLHIAAKHKQVKSLAYFLKLGLDINQPDSFGMTALHWAAVSGCETTLMFVLAWTLKAGGDVNAKQINGKTALHTLVKSQIYSTKGVKMLLFKGADPEVVDCWGR